jgi:hypothetical protein
MLAGQLLGLRRVRMTPGRSFIPMVVIMVTMVMSVRVPLVVVAMMAMTMTVAMMMIRSVMCMPFAAQEA